jgi:hypothetical protein
MHVELSDEEKVALATELKRIISKDRYPLSPRVRILQAILDKLDPPLAPERCSRRNIMSHRASSGGGAGAGEPLRLAFDAPDRPR